MQFGVVVRQIAHQIMPKLTDLSFIFWHSFLHSLSVSHSISGIGSRNSRALADELPSDSCPSTNQTIMHKASPSIINFMVVQLQTFQANSAQTPKLCRWSQCLFVIGRCQISAVKLHVDSREASRRSLFCNEYLVHFLVLILCHCCIPSAASVAEIQRKFQMNCSWTHFQGPIIITRIRLIPTLTTSWLCNSRSHSQTSMLCWGPQCLFVICRCQISTAVSDR